MTLPKAVLRLALILLVGLSLVLFTLAPWQSALERHIKNNGDHVAVSLTPRFFILGQTRKEATALVENLGFRRGGLLLQPDLDSIATGTEPAITYWKSSRADGIMFLLCSVDVVVLLQFDEAGLLASAGGRARPVCL